ncbi:hypothetical protein RR46_05826 [Papilio xuthus]|uniref:Uncharacterized protein n=1 Tax=Papilio xuthus TaxID=66420 RepID=A0A194PPB5_PAPXU|nr:hypothetical protein RR46_05826 [Papilio xuthus]
MSVLAAYCSLPHSAARHNPALALAPVHNPRHNPAPDPTLSRQLALAAARSRSLMRPPKTPRAARMQKIRTRRVGDALRLSETCARTCSASL